MNRTLARKYKVFRPESWLKSSRRALVDGRDWWWRMTIKPIPSILILPTPDWLYSDIFSLQWSQSFKSIYNRFSAMCIRYDLFTWNEPWFRWWSWKINAIIKSIFKKESKKKTNFFSFFFLLDNCSRLFYVLFV